MAKYIPTFGVEIHAALDTKTKAFSPAENVFGEDANTKIHPVDLGYPGAKPRVNGKMVEHSFRLAKALKMNTENTMYFDRKNYFYPDLSAGYQITQYERPIGREGKITIELADGSKKDISVTEIHMEQDTAKQIRKEGRRLFDFNRAGAPLIEIVSGHEELASVEEVLEYVKTMREQLVVLGISRAILAEGTFRVDINVSIRSEIQEEYGTRVEIKNLNSFNNIKLALDYELKTMEETLESGKEVESVTKRWDEDKQETISMRSKDTSTLYNFITEGNITPIELSEDFIHEALAKGVPSTLEIRDEYKSHLSEDEYASITQAGPIFNLFKNLSDKNEVKAVANFITQTLMSVLKSNKDKMTNTILESINFDGILELIKDKKATNKQIVAMITKAIDGGDITYEIKKLKETEQMSSNDIQKIIDEIIAKDERIQVTIESKPETAQKAIMGQVMKATKGQVNPVQANKLIAKKLGL